MKILVPSITENPVSLLRRAGYVFQRQDDQEMSFVRVLGSQGYPRFHCYTTLTGIALSVNLHLDQKKHTYGEGTRHHGEYEDSQAVQEEAAHLLKIFGAQASIV